MHHYRSDQSAKSQIQSDMILMNARIKHTDAAKPFSDDLLRSQQEACESLTELKSTGRLCYMLWGFGQSRCVQWEYDGATYTRHESINRTCP